ncbi:MAG: hypothetical protein Q8P13_01905 [bacterium]|nr:hypothetical protein [bacterium]
MLRRFSDLRFATWFFLVFVTVVCTPFGFVMVNYLDYTRKEAVFYMAQPFVIGVWVLITAYGIRGLSGQHSWRKARREVIVAAQTEVKVKSFSWFAYMESDGSKARAISPMLGLLVVRPTVREAVDEMLGLAEDYLKFAIEAGDEDVSRPTPVEAVEAHLLKFIWQCSSRAEMQGQFWSCGVIQKDLSKAEWDE